MTKVGINRKGFRPTSQESDANKKKCEEAFNKGYPILYAAGKLELNKNTVNKYYLMFREDMAANMDKEFISEQRYHKAHAMRALQSRMEVLEEQVTRLKGRVEEDEENPTWESNLTKSLIELSNLEQQMHGLGMSRTVDISLRKLVERIENGESGNNNTK